jgi:hypothetical protein
MKERRKVSDVLGIKNLFHAGWQLTFTKRALRPGQTTEQRLECKIRLPDAVWSSLKLNESQSHAPIGVEHEGEFPWKAAPFAHPHPSCMARCVPA